MTGSASLEEVRTDAALPRPSLGELTRVFAAIGVLSFGGPAGQIALMHRMLVEERRWLSDDRFMHALNFCMLLPGPEAQQLATYSGWLLHGTRGGLIAGMLFILPGFVVILALSAAYVLLGDTGLLDGLFFGLKAAVLAIVLEALVRVARRALRRTVDAALAAAAFAALFAFSVPFPLVIGAAALVGLLGSRGRAAGPAEAEPFAAGGTVLRAVRLVVAWGALWAAAPLAVVALVGPDAVFGPLAVFFSKMAVVTFGGAYAVLAYVAQQAVETYAWLAPGEMLDGLALAETTPGPLILVLTFVGFLAAFRDPGALDPLLAGLLGAGLVTWVTFVPCFLWIFLGAPHMERIRGNPRLAGALSAITAAVVGVIANLAAWFALHVLFAEVGEVRAGPLALPLPDPASLDLAAFLLAAAAVLALLRFRIGVPLTLALAGAAGIAIDWAG